MMMRRQGFACPIQNWGLDHGCCWAPLLLILILFALLVGCSEKKGGKQGGLAVVGVEEGNLAPDFRLRRINGAFSTLSQYRGKVVLINFWATWCVPCRDEMPAMEVLYRAYQQDGFEILAISIDRDDEEGVRDFVEEFGFRFPVLLDPDLVVNDLYHVRVVPTSLLIDRRGGVAFYGLGARDWSDVESRQQVKKLLEE